MLHAPCGACFYGTNFSLFAARVGVYQHIKGPVSRPLGLGTLTGLGDTFSSLKQLTQLLLVSLRHCSARRELFVLAFRVCPRASFSVTLSARRVARRPDPVYTFLHYQPGHGPGPRPPACIPSTSSSSCLRAACASSASLPLALSLPVYPPGHGSPGGIRPRVPY